MDPILGSKTKLGLIRTMLEFPDRRWTGRELARAAHRSTAQTARDLAELANTSLVLRDVTGRSYSWELNPTHVLLPTLEDLFSREANLRAEMVRQVASALGSTPFERARLFGSVARGEERDDSDVDLFIQIRAPAERGRAEEAIDRVRSRIWSRFGNPVSALVYTRAEVKRPPNPGLLKTIETEGIDVKEARGLRMGRTEVLPKSRHRVFLARAREFAQQMDHAVADRAWNSVGLLGVHCVISACDALTVQRAGQRWSGQDHAGVSGVVRSLDLPKSDTVLRQISNVLDQKNRVEYEAREFTEPEADEIRQSATWILAWVATQLRP
ncbi:MAG: nucleotidyltransferase domain-containing protein [Thermoplasmata archaeon]